MSDEKRNQKRKMDLSSLVEPGKGAKKSAPHVPEKKAAEEIAKEIRFESIGGRCIIRAEKFRGTPDPTDDSANDPTEDDGNGE
jgi:hypothetical protein